MSVSLSTVKIARDVDNLFIYPTAPGPATNFVANEVWELGSTIDIQWTTSAHVYHIELYQQELDIAHATTKGNITRQMFQPLYEC